MKLTINAIATHVEVADPMPSEGTCIIRANAGTSTSLKVTPSQLARMEGQLRALEARTLGNVVGASPIMTWSVDMSDSDTRDQFGDAGSAVPALTVLSAASVSVGTPATGVVLHGVNLLNKQAIATQTIGGVVYTAVSPGSTGNQVNITHVVAGLGTSLSVTAVGNAVTVNLATNGSGVATSTQTLIAAALAAYSGTKYLVTAAGGATVASAATATYLGGGAGAGMKLMVGKDTMNISAVTATAVTFDTIALTQGANGNLALLNLTNGAQSLSMTVPLVT
jgi:hypothetical protein